MSMYNSTNSHPWQPLNFRDFTTTASSSMLNVEDDVTTVAIETLSLVNDREDENSAINLELEQLKVEISEQAYQTGLELGKQEGFEVGQTSGYQQGYQAGLAQGLADADQQNNEERMKLVQSMASLLANFQQALNGLDDLIVPKLADLALIAAQKMVGELPKTEHQQLMITIQSLIKQLPILSEHVQLHVNPTDISSVEVILEEELNKYQWQLVSEPSIESGGCKLFTDKNEIDATLTSRWQTITDSVHGERT